jgi:hypothetical protein
MRQIRAKEIFSEEYSGHRTKRSNSFPSTVVVEQILLAICSFVAVKFVGPSAQVRKGKDNPNSSKSKCTLFDLRILESRLVFSVIVTVATRSDLRPAAVYE